MKSLLLSAAIAVTAFGASAHASSCISVGDIPYSVPAGSCTYGLGDTGVSLTDLLRGLNQLSEYPPGGPCVPGTVVVYDPIDTSGPYQLLYVCHKDPAPATTGHFWVSSFSASKVN